MRALLLATVVACGGASDTTPIANAPPLPPPVTTPAPTVRWVDNGFDGARLPAIASDGQTLVLGVRDADGARGNPNFRIEVRDRGDVIRATHTVLTAVEVDSGAFFDETGVLASLRDRIAGANAELARLHATHHLAPLGAMVLEPTEDSSGPQGGYPRKVARLGSIAVAWRSDRLVITRDGTVVLDRAAPAGWLAPPRTRGGGVDRCGNPAFLDAAWLAPDERLVVIRIAYAGDDTCWEPDARTHVVTW